MFSPFPSAVLIQSEVKLNALLSKKKRSFVSSILDKIKVMTASGSHLTMQSRSAAQQSIFGKSLRN